MLLFTISAQVYELRQALLSEEAACVAAPAEETSAVVSGKHLTISTALQRWIQGTRHSCLQGALDPNPLTQNCCKSAPAKRYVSVWLFHWLHFVGLRSLTKNVIYLFIYIYIFLIFYAYTYKTYTLNRKPQTINPDP